jgi:hypothetical protein
MCYFRTVPPRGNSEICHFASSDLAGLSFEVGDKIAFRIVQFQRQKTSSAGEYQLKVESCKGSEHVTDKTGTMHNDRRMGWIIIDDEVNERQESIYYYPLKNLAEKYLKEGLPVKFSGELYPSWITPWNVSGLSECHYLSIDAIEELTSDNYYYYQGNKIPLTQNENKIVVSVLKADNEVSERILANIQILGSIKDETYDIYVITRSEYEKLTTLDFWTVDAKSAILTSSYFTENNEEVFATPYLNVRLKKEEDADLLTSYAEQYKLTIVGHSPLMPLWYILAVTPESGKSPVECANELYESGNFASSVPDLSDAIKPQPQLVYRPFVEEGKVWKVGALNSGNPVQVVKYYYFEGDTIINGMTCKKMMCQQYVDPDFAESNSISQDNSLSYVGAWYEEDQKVYFCDATNNQFKLMYDFSLGANATFEVDNLSYVIGPRQTGGIEGFKGVHRDVRRCESGENSYSPTWMEGVGSIDDPTKNVYYVDEAPSWCLMSCTVGDEVIYLNDEYEDGATPESLESRKHRFDFTHTVKTKPKAPIKRVKSGDYNGSSEREVARMKVKAPMRSVAEASEEQSLYGDYNDVQLDINLNPLYDAYLVCITDETGKAVYEKTINAASIVALNIDISDYAEGRYTVTVENSNESFTGEIELEKHISGISDLRLNKDEEIRNTIIYNLHGQRISSLQKGLNIVNGQKVFAK